MTARWAGLLTMRGTNEREDHMITGGRIAAAAAGLLIALALALPASAHHATPTVEVEPGDCGAVTWSTAWASDDHQVANATLVVQAHGEQHVAPIGEGIEVDGTEDETATIRWRIWGGGERDYDSPPLDDLAALVAYLSESQEHSPLDTDAPGLAWHELTVEGCPPADDEDPGEDPGDEQPGDEQPGDGDGDEKSAPGAGGGQELPKTGVPALALGAAGLAALVVGGGLMLVRRRAPVG